MLSPSAQNLLNNYLSLPFSGVSGVRCPYFINLRANRRGQIRSLIGKGTPAEIVEEAKIISIQYHRGIFDHDGKCCVHGEHHAPHCHSDTIVIPTAHSLRSVQAPEESPSKQPINEDPSSARASVGMTTQADCIRRFLIDNQLGIDCSGFVTHILRAHFWETKKIDIAKNFVKNISGGFLRKIIMRLRPVESIGVKSGYGNDLNTTKLGDETTGYDFAKIQTGDVVVMLGVGQAVIPTEAQGRAEESLEMQALRDSSASLRSACLPVGMAQNDRRRARNHILLITECDGKIIKYAHARAWSSEGQYGHGVNIGEIKIIAPGKGLLSQEWTEKSPALPADLFHQANTNETFSEAKRARVLEVRRIKI
jgi:hypothetical protein